MVFAQVAALGNLAIYDHMQSNFAAARTGYQQVLERCEQHRLVMAGLIARYNLVAIDQAQGQLAAAIAGYEQAIAGYERYAAVNPSDLENLAEIYIQIGAFERAAVLLARAETLWHERDGAVVRRRWRLLSHLGRAAACDLVVLPLRIAPTGRQRYHFQPSSYKIH